MSFGASSAGNCLRSRSIGMMMRTRRCCPFAMSTKGGRMFIMENKLQSSSNATVPITCRVISSFLVHKGCIFNYYQTPTSYQNDFKQDQNNSDSQKGYCPRARENLLKKLEQIREKYSILTEDTQKPENGSLTGTKENGRQITLQSISLWKKSSIRGYVAVAQRTL